jgi:hypothetical protein
LSIRLAHFYMGLNKCYQRLATAGMLDILNCSDLFMNMHRYWKELLIGRTNFTNTQYYDIKR